MNASPLAETYDPPLLTRDEMRRENALSAPREPLRAETGAGVLSVTAGPRFLLTSWDGSWARIDFAIADRIGQAHVPLDIILKVTGDAFPDLPFDSIDPRLRAIVLEHVLANAVGGLETHFQAPLRLADVQCPVPLAPDFQSVMRVALGDGQPFPMTVSASPIDMGAILRSLEGLARVRRRPAGLMTTVSLRAGHAQLSLDELAALEVGAGIILDGTYLTFQKIAAVTGERFVQTCTWQSLKPVLDGPLLRKPDVVSVPFTTGAVMSDENAGDGSAPFGTVNDIPVHLVFELGRMTISVDEVETLAQGHVFDLGKPLSQAVDILSGGRRIGTGELVRIADSIGVRITRIAT